MIHVVAIVTVKAGQRNSVLREFRQIIPSVHAEKGCIEYVLVLDTPNGGPVQSPLGPDSYCVIEKWESLETLGAHAVAPHMAAFGAKVKDQMANRVIHILSPA